MKPKLKTLVIVIALGFAAYVAYAENVTISTYYPSPYGSYQTLETTGLTNLATAGSNVVIGATGAGTNKLTVTGVGGGNVDVRVNGRIHTGDAGGAGGVWVDNGQTMFVGQNGTSVGFWVNGNWRLNANSDGTTSVTGTLLGPGAGGSLSVRDQSGNTGVLQVSCDGTNCYPVYA